jgi:hypothetical protein
VRAALVAGSGRLCTSCDGLDGWQPMCGCADTSRTSLSETFQASGLVYWNRSLHSPSLTHFPHCDFVMPAGGRRRGAPATYATYRWGSTQWRGIEPRKNTRAEGRWSVQGNWSRGGVRSGGEGRSTRECARWGNGMACAIWGVRRRSM